ncbi:hypothetical protein HJFPF1_02835 [Paramyrothecium foliicola]|nr:hypothetical protein HJFPF1_02835 [Paramyrothecium foliicola]
MDSKSIKQAVMQQVLQESSVANARVLIEVRIRQIQFNFLCDAAIPSLTSFATETPGELLREVRSQAWQLPLQWREVMHDNLHGEVYGRLEPRQLGLHRPSAQGTDEPFCLGETNDPVID